MESSRPARVRDSQNKAQKCFGSQSWSIITFPALRRLWQDCELEASLCHRVNSRPTWATEWDQILEKPNQTNESFGVRWYGKISLEELYKCVGKAQQVLTGLVTNAYNPSTLEAKASGSWVWGSLSALITWWDPVCQTATEPCVATSADRRPDLNYLFYVGSVLSSCWQAAPCKPLCERKRGKSLQPVISVAGWIQAAPRAWGQDILHVNRCWVFIMCHLAPVV